MTLQLGSLFSCLYGLEKHFVLELEQPQTPLWDMGLQNLDGLVSRKTLENHHS